MPAGSESQALAPTDTSSRPDAQDHKWVWCRDKIISLYWEQNLPLKQVQEILRREDGLKATWVPKNDGAESVHKLKQEATRQKQYKGRFRKWGIRKNINIRKAREIISAQGTACDFWPEKMQDNYERRIARHLKNESRNQTCSPQSCSPVAEDKLIPRPEQISPGPVRLRAPGNLENLERTLYNTEAWILFTVGPSKTGLASRKVLGEHDRFFPTFIGGLESLSRDHEPQKAFSDIREASKHLKALVTLDDPAVYWRLVARLSSFERHPQSDTCFEVCRLLTRCLGAMNLEVHGPSHPLNFVWSSYVEMLESRPERGFFQHYLELVIAIGVKLYDNGNSLNLGATVLSKYITSSYRQWDEEALRRGLADSAYDAAVQIRLALAELLLDQSKADEAIKLLEETTSLKQLNAAGDVGQLFWVAELEWRAGNPTASFALLREALDLADSGRITPSLVDDTLDEVCGVSKLLILHTLFLRLNMMGRTQETTEVMERTARLLAARGDKKPFVLHLTSSDFEFDLDTGLGALAITD